MTQTPDPTDPSVADAEAKLARLTVQVDAMQAVLVRLLQDVVTAEARLSDSEAARLVEANEQLVVAALANQAKAEAAATALEQAAQSTTLDALTGLPNRTALRDRFLQAIANAKRHGSRFALLFVDLDNFKEFNDTHGHTFGDKVLCLVAARLLAAARGVDTVSRHGGDEFLILLSELNQPDDARMVAAKLIAAIGVPAYLDGEAVSVTASVGISIYPDDGEDFDTLVARADAAMYQTKRQRAGGIGFHGVGLIEESVQQAQPGSPAHSPAGKSAGDAMDPALRHAQLREANEKLVLAVLNAQELQAAAEQARQRQAALMAAVAEELRNPLAPVRIAAAMLGREPSDNLLLLPRLQDIGERQMTQVSRLVDKLLDAAGVHAGGLELDSRLVDLAQVIDDAVAANRPTMEQRGQHFASQRPLGALYVRGAAARLEQIVSNLLDNASKYTPDGGWINLSVEVADTLKLTVSDSGIGITPQMLPYVFDPFVQDIRGFGLNGVGLGIGLTVVRALVRAHGGDVVAYSAGAARGSRFVVTLPLAASVTIAPDAESAAGVSARDQ